MFEYAIFKWLKDHWLQVVAYLVIAAVVWFVASRIYSAGEEHEKAKWMEKQNKELVDANAEIVRLNADLVKRKQENDLEIFNISKEYQDDLAQNKATADRVIADMRKSGSGLRIPIVINPINPDQHTDTGRTASTCELGRETSANLPIEVSEDIVRLLSEADDTATQVTGLQKAYETLRKDCKITARPLLPPY